MKKSVQLYAIRALASHNLEAAIKTAADIGYEGVEFAGFFDNSAGDVASWLTKYNIAVSSAHVDYKLITEHTDETIAYHKAIGNTRIICPGYAMKTAEDAITAAKALTAVYPKFKAAGMILGYHNHSHEFLRDDGKCLIDIFAENTPEDLQLEFDAYWVYRGGENPAEYMKKYASRVNLFHAKDGNAEVGTTLGQGSVDLKPVFRFAEEHNFSWAVVESEANEDEALQIKSITDDYAALIELMK